jgi:hypothetical protein
MKDIHKRNSFNRLNLSLIFVLIRLIMSLNIIRRKCDCRWKRQIINIFDLLFFILVNISLIRYSNKNLIRIGRKIILGLLIFQLNDLSYNETFWIDSTKWDKSMKHLFSSTVPLQPDDLTSHRMKTIHLILSIRWIFSLFIICLFIFFTFQSIIIDEIDTFSSIKYIYIFLKVHAFDGMMCITLLYVVYWDTLQNRNTLKQYGISRFCTGLDLLSIIRSTEMSFHPKIQPNTTFVEDIK